MKLPRFIASLSSRCSRCRHSPARPTTSRSCSKAATAPARASTSSSSAATRNTAQKKTIPQLAQDSLEAARLQMHRAIHHRAERPAPSTRTVNNIPGLEALKTADLMVIFTRFLNLPDEQMQHIADYLARGGPVVGLRTATHAFNGIPAKSKFAKFNNGSGVKGWEGGFGKTHSRREVGESPRRARQGRHTRHRCQRSGEAPHSQGHRHRARSSARPTCTLSRFRWPAIACRSFLAK